MPSYRVEWAIDVDADNPREAAIQAEDQQKNQVAGHPMAVRGVFDVFREDGHKIRVDLSDPEDQGEDVTP